MVPYRCHIGVVPYKGGALLGWCLIWVVPYLGGALFSELLASEELSIPPETVTTKEFVFATQTWSNS